MKINTTDVIENLAGYIGFKNLKSELVAVNSSTAQLLGFKKASDVEGLTDYELKSDVAEFADEFRLEDRLVEQTGKAIKSIRIIDYSTGTHALLNTKKPCYDRKGDLWGTVTHGVDIPSEHLKFFIKQIQSSELDLDGEFYLIECYKRYQLNVFRSNCLFFFTHGYSINQMSIILNVTQEKIAETLHFIQCILYCTSKEMLKDKLIADGLYRHIPMNLIKMKKISIHNQHLHFYMLPDGKALYSNACEHIENAS